MTRRIGLLGGTFDPVHYGHLQLAELALRQCELAIVLFIPAVSPPHKVTRKIAEFRHRVAMLELALADQDVFFLSLLEDDLPVPSYTVDTLTYLRKNQRDDDEFYFIIGEDAFLEICSWKSYEELLTLTHFIVAGRTGYSTEYFQTFVHSLGYVLNGKTWRDTTGKNQIVFLPAQTDDVSSTAVRERILKNMSLEGFLPEEVVKYIEKFKLYGSSAVP